MTFNPFLYLLGEYPEVSGISAIVAFRSAISRLNVPAM